MKLPKIGVNVFIVVGLVLLVLSGLTYFGVIPILGYTIDPLKPDITISFGKRVAYVKIAVNGQVVIEENVGFDFIANRVVNVEAGDIVSVWFKWEEGYGGYVKVRVAKLPSYNWEPNCIKILGVSGNGPPGVKHDIMMYVYNIIVNPDGTRTRYQSDYVIIDLPDAPITTPTPTPSPTPTPTPTPTPMPTTTATITSITATTTTTGTVTLTTTGTTTTTTIAPTTTIEANTYAPNRIASLILGIAGALSILVGFRRPI